MCDKNASCSTSNKETEPYFDFTSTDLKVIVKMKAFVDKTLLIKCILQESSMILITAPRHFGKSANLDMVKKFFEIQVDNNGAIIETKDSSNYQIFKDNQLLIFQDIEFFDKHFATYPVIYTSFQRVYGNTFDEVLDKFREVLHETFKQHEYLLKSDKLRLGEISKFNKYFDEESFSNLTETEVKDGLRFLSKCLYKHFSYKQVYVLIDDYDALINNTMFKENINFNQVNEMLRMIFSHSLKENKYVERALLTGISYFATVGFSGISNVDTFMFLSDHKFVPYYGLTEGEVNKLLTDCQIDSETKEKVKSRYNGYLSSNGTKLFSMWSILHFLQKKEIQNYWVDSSVMTNLEEALNFPAIRWHIEALCLGKSVEIEICSRIDPDDIHLKNICLQIADYETRECIRPDIYLNFLLQQGYLTLDEKVKDQLHTSKYTVKISNAEIFSEFRTKLWNYYGKSINACIKNCAVSFEKIFSSSDKEISDFITKFNEVLDKLKNKFIEYNEDTYRCIMFYILCKSKFSLVLCNTKFSKFTRFTSPRARTYLFACERKLGIIVELGYKKSSEKAFDNSFFKNVTEHIYIGLNVSENKVADSVFEIL